MSRRGHLVLGLALGVPVGTLDGQWSVSMRAMQNPLAVGQCTPIEIVTTVPGAGAPVRPDGHQVSGFDFDLELAAPTDAFVWQDERHRFLCAVAPTAASAVVVATYPARHLKSAELVPGVALQQAVEVTLAGAAPGPSGYPAPPTAYPAPAPDPQPAPGAAPP